MSNILSQVTTNKQSSGIRVVIAGVEKIGKTTLACGSSRPLLIPLEIGYAGVNVNKTPFIESYENFILLLDEIIESCKKDKFIYKTIVIDSVTALERLIHLKVLSLDPLWKAGNSKGLIMDNALGGYGKAYNMSNELFSGILSKLDQIVINKNTTVIMTAHVFANNVVDPTSGEYQTWDLLLHSPKNNKTYGKREILSQWTDLIGFLYEPVYINKSSDNVSLGISANKGRILGLERTPGYVAGNRFGCKGEISIPKEQCWNYLADCIYKSSGIDVYNKDLS